MVTGIIILILGNTGIITRVMSYLPMSIMMAMVSGVLFPFALEIILVIFSNPLLNGVTFAAFLLLSLSRKLARSFPLILGANIVAVILALFLDVVDDAWTSFANVEPMIAYL